MGMSADREDFDFFPDGKMVLKKNKQQKQEPLRAEIRKPVAKVIGSLDEPRYVLKTINGKEVYTR